jgi:folate-binding protein YgfZ
VSPSPFSLQSLSAGVAEQVRQTRQSGSLWREDGWALLRLRGTDAKTWLHGQCSQSVTDLKPGEGRQAALLDPRAALIAVFDILADEQGLLLLIADSELDFICERFQRYLFVEDVEVEVQARDQQALWLQGPEVAQLLVAFGEAPSLPMADRSWTLHEGLVWIRQTRSGEAGVMVVGDEEQIEELSDHLLARAGGKALPIGDEAAQVLRLEAGLPLFGTEVSTRQLLPETPWMESAFAPGKGCFTGQEVVERLRMKGSPKVALVALLGEPNMPAPTPGSKVMIAGKGQGVFSSSVPSPTLGGRLCYAYLKRLNRAPDARFTVQIDAHDWPVKLLWLPPVAHRPDSLLADEAYDKALGFFTEDAEDKDPRVVTWLRKARLHNPEHLDSLELLGLALQRRGELNEATELMKTLVEHQPDSIMGWTNLSRFYAEAGLIDPAEEAQGRATMLSFRADLAARKVAVSEAKLAEHEQNERRSRMEMFREVLEFDDEDLVALFGLGKAQIAEGEDALAVGLLERAVEVKPDYAAAWLELGQAQQRLGNIAGAQTSYLAGIAAAAKRGELMPMRAMERRLKEL